MTSSKSPESARTTPFRHCDQPQPASRTVRDLWARTYLIPSGTSDACGGVMVPSGF